MQNLPNTSRLGKKHEEMSERPSINQYNTSINNSNHTDLINFSKKPEKICSNCGLPILQNNKSNKSTLKALGKYYHEQCFKCHDCSKPLIPKYFPYEIADTKETLLLCQYDYFKRHDLLCHVCDKPLRGLYYTAFGERYDEEHFSCSICGEACGVKKCFMKDGKLFCRYHFLKYFSKRCNGCQYPISDRYIEFPRGEEIQCWHPECYGIHKYWHVMLSSYKLGLSPVPTVAYKKGDIIDDTKPTKSEMDSQMQAFITILTKTWSVLYKFEEHTASCISDMFQYLTSVDQLKGLESAALLVLKIECLFKSLNFLKNNLEQETNEAIEDTKSEVVEEESQEDAFKLTSQNGNFNLKKLSRNLTSKIMVYLQLLRKLNSEVESSNVKIASFMSIITGLAHYLKLLTRCGLYMALEMNQKSHTSVNLLKFLKEVEKNELYESNPFQYIKLSVKVTDNCYSCGKYIQEECIQYQDKRWHTDCLVCSACHNSININNLSDATFNSTKSLVLCADCSIDDPISIPGFKYVSRLSQLIFLLKIALVRSKAVTETQLKNKSTNHKAKNAKEAIKMQESYVRTLNDITKLKSRRESVRIARKQNVRMSMLLEKTDTEYNATAVELEDKVISDTEPPNSSKDPSSPENVFSAARSLTLDDISRIVAAEQARELRPNAFTHFKKLNEIGEESIRVLNKNGCIYYSQLSTTDLSLLRAISFSILSVNDKLLEGMSDLSQLTPVLEKVEKGNSSMKFWIKMKEMINKDSKKSSTKKLFGASLEELCIKYGVQSDLGVGPSKIQVPIIVDELISCLRQMDLSVEGIFRINGNIRRLRELSAAIDKNPSVIPDLSKESAIQLSALLKKFIRSLPEPLMTKSLYQLWINAAKIENENEKRKVMSLIYSMLPIYNRNVLEVIFSFLYWTSSFSHIENEMGSKMDIHNLSTVMTPNILYSSTEDNSTGIQQSTNDTTKPSTYHDAFAQNEGENYFLAIEVIDYLITHNEEIAMVPKYLNNLLSEIKANKLDNYECIKSFVIKELSANSYKFDSQDNELKSKTMKMVHSPSIITQNEKSLDQ
ncbi:hypothetical protein Kpol_529p25 [Vanderwaltozyma polyspora DSM 70294]|uniref:Rho-GTPase-activating protein LRG1 n=1 Tax=Vanderwaltozyma polyspora (strain ATCC 22028 / DSM 70294 / BCRC 21397 / CBS 2163 / NBRC 10782 / NRRL Y-8283 / UCD 57-17) TaxID=436907 RepID=A7TM78_VANPO|nr:uncharacterized protein Kpol_529p25 [Vanderwaltozyma polyspora DSM 70294]EDO16645.1 hypothetical protein Kpol_529p25 [Vanderwaltozyma polyspora DSM 70294]